MRRDFIRRLTRLEARAAAVRASETFSMKILFVHPEKGVVRALLMEQGKQVWVNVDGDQQDEGSMAEQITDEKR